MRKHSHLFLLLFLFLFSCSKHGGDGPGTPDPLPASLRLNNVILHQLIASASATNYNIDPATVIKMQFNNKVNRSTASTAVAIRENGTAIVPVNINFANSDSTVLVSGIPALKFLTKYTLSINTSLKSVEGANLVAPSEYKLLTKIDSGRKFPILPDDALLTKVQQQTFTYFWDFAHPVSGLARERNSSGDVVTTGGSGFGIMAIPVAINRNFITRAQGLERMQKIVGFLKNTAVKVKGAFPHWLNGATGAIVPFSSFDDGADLVETSFLMMGLLAARQYFNDAGAAETTLRNDINTLYQNVDWDWFRQGGQQVLYWHYSNTNGWAINLPIKGWNECLVTYVLAASSSTHPVPASVYNNGWKSGSQYVNGNTYYGYNLPLGPPQGGPLFFSHYSFLGINPTGLYEAGIDYNLQTKNHTRINYQYCRDNPQNYFGYSDSVWGLTASDIENGYTASSPSHEVGVIAPTAAISSMPYSPDQSMAALKFYYYVLGDKIWNQYGFTDAFSLQNTWFANSTLAIDQGPIIVMIENYRTGLLWNLFTSCPEVVSGMQSLGFTAPYL